MTTMNALKYYGVFRGDAKVPTAAFALKSDAENYKGRRTKMIIKECWMDCGCPCPNCGNLVACNAEDGDK